MITSADQASSPKKQLLSKLTGLVFWLLITFTAAWFGASYEPGTWYTGINKPAWTPPGWVFPPVWTFLYISMALAAWLVWMKGGWKVNRMPLFIFLVQLAFNAAWSLIFFGKHLIGLALIDIICLFSAIVIVTVLFWKRRRPAGILMLPYAAWVGFATALNFQIWRIN